MERVKSMFCALLALLVTACPATVELPPEPDETEESGPRIKELKCGIGSFCIDDPRSCTFQRCVSGSCRVGSRPNGAECRDETAYGTCWLGECVME